MTNASRPTSVAAYVNVAEAELARMQLATEGIPARLDNATLVLWFWHYSNATGGVKVLVAERHVPRAKIVLSARPTPPQWRPPTWPCPRCHAEVDGLWHYCWSCGTSRDGAEDPHFFDEPPALTADADGPSPQLAAGFLAFAVVLLLLGLSSSAEGTALCGLALFLALVAACCHRPACGVEEAAAVLLPGVMREPAWPFDGPDGLRLEEQSDAFLRTWQAAALSLFFFQPLGLYVLWKLCRIEPPAAALPPRDRRRYWGAWAVASITVPLGVLRLVAVAGAIVYLAFDFWRLAAALATPFSAPGGKPGGW
jgi:hypothetical protein